MQEAQETQARREGERLLRASQRETEEGFRQLREAQERTKRLKG